mgnify:CR=1 FL=1
MAHFAKVENGIVTQVIVADQEFIDSGALGDPSTWIQTSYNKKFRVHYAGQGFFYDSQRDAFIPPKPYNSWILNEESCLWESPISYPQDDKRYTWNEETVSWIEVVN